MNRRLASVAGVAIGLAGLVFIVVRISRDWDQIVDTVRSASIGWLLVAVLAGVASMTVIAVNWLSLIERRGHHVPVRKGLRWFFTGQLGKYVPGGIWPVVGQAELATRAGLDRRTTYLATASSMTTTLLGAATVVAVSGLASPFDRRIIAVLFALGLCIGWAALVIPPVRAVLTRATSGAGRRIGRGDVDLPEGRVVTVYTLRHVPVWLLYAAMTAAVLVALGGSMDGGLVVDVVFASSLSWIVGFVIIGVPGGLGVRETVFVALMTEPIGATLALSVAVTCRLVTLAVDLLGAVVAELIGRFSSGSVQVRSHLDVTSPEAGDPDPVLQRGSDAPPDAG